MISIISVASEAGECDPVISYSAVFSQTPYLSCPPVFYGFEFLPNIYLNYHLLSFRLLFLIIPFSVTVNNFFLYLRCNLDSINGL